MFFNHRMVEGSPLHYYPYVISSSPPAFQYFSRFDSYKMSDDFMMPNSPNSTQSDSDVSISSIDVHLEPIQRKISPTNVQNKTIETQCCWQNCGIIFESLDRLSDHVSKVHATSGLGGLYYCGWTGCARNNKGFNARYKMLVHVRTHTNEKPHQCHLCHKSFSRAENLKIHIRSHSGERPYICNVPGCNKAYSNSSDRFKHTRTHQVDKPYQCKVPGCPKRYTDPSSLRKHVKTYKHFVNENSTNEIKNLDDQRVKLEINMAEPEVRTVNGQAYQPTTRCNCNHNCYLSKCLEVNDYNIKKSWNNLIDPYFKSYQLKENQMDVELPLDLSISRRHL